MTKQGDRYRYFHARNVNGRTVYKGITGDKDVQMRLARKEFLGQTIEGIDRNIGLMGSMVRKFTTFDPASVIGEMKRAYRSLPEKYFFYRGAGAMNNGESEADHAVAALPESPESPQGAGTGSRTGRGGGPGPGMIIRKYQEPHQSTLRASAPERMGTVPGSPGRLAATIQMAAPLAAPEIWCQIPQAAGETAQTASLRVGLPFLQRRQQWKRRQLRGQKAAA